LPFSAILLLIIPLFILLRVISSSSLSWLLFSLSHVKAEKATQRVSRLANATNFLLVPTSGAIWLGDWVEVAAIHGLVRYRKFATRAKCVKDCKAMAVGAERHKCAARALPKTLSRAVTIDEAFIAGKRPPPTLLSSSSQYCITNGYRIMKEAMRESIS
jgi:hypothetical protein